MEKEKINITLEKGMNNAQIVILEGQALHFNSSGLTNKGKKTKFRVPILRKLKSDPAGVKWVPYLKTKRNNLWR